MIFRDARREYAVHFLRERLPQVARAQPSFNVRDRHAAIKRAQRRGEGGVRVALHHNQVRPLGVQNRFDAAQNPRRDAAQRLARLHQVEIEIRTDSEGFQHRVQHVAVLGRDTDSHLEVVRLRAQPFDQRAELDGLRPRPENKKNPAQRSSIAAINGALRCGSAARAFPPERKTPARPAAPRRSWP